MSLVIENARIVTQTGAGVIERGSVWLQGDAIHEVGERVDAPGKIPRIDARGRVLQPAFVDAHTHACFAGERFAEWELKLEGASYLEIAAAGGGIASTVEATRKASADELAAALLERLETMCRLGTTTVEVKSGYGLSTEHELRMLRAIRQAGERFVGVVHPCACIGHAKDPSLSGEDFVQQTIEETLPAVHAEFPGVPIDAYCEEGAWSVAEVERLFVAAAALGHPLRLHVDQFHALGGLELAISLGARSADHLEATDAEMLGRLGASSTTGVFLPISGLHTDDRYADARPYVAAGGRPVVATNLNPGSAPSASMPLALQLAVRKNGLTPRQALAAGTVNAARLLDERPGLGTVAAGAPAELVVLHHHDERALVHELGGDPVALTISRGRVVAGEGVASATRLPR